MTAPLTPPDCDLKDFAYMPLDVARLRQSELASDETPEVCWAAVLLWCASWHEVPAGSIPNNDQWQAKQAGYVARGKIDEAWGSVRDGALRGFVLCDDGRLYHPVVAEKAREAWSSKQRHAYGKMQDRIRKANKLRTEQGLGAIDVPTLEQWVSSGKVDPVPPEVDTPSAGIPPESPLKGEGKGKGKGSKGESAQQAARTLTQRPQREQTTLTAYLESCKAAGIKPVPEGHAIRQWCANAGITTEMLQVAWVQFRERYTEGEKGKRKRYIDWASHFATSVKDNWFGLWFMGDDNRPAWSSKGLMHKSVLDAKHSQLEVAHAVD